MHHAKYRPDDSVSSRKQQLRRDDEMLKDDVDSEKHLGSISTVSLNK